MESSKLSTKEIGKATFSLVDSNKDNENNEFKVDIHSKAQGQFTSRYRNHEKESQSNNIYSQSTKISSHST